MAAYDIKSDILKRIENLNASIADQPSSLPTSQTYLESLARMIEGDDSLFELEAWHALEGDRQGPAEMLLRIKEKDGTALPPYPFVMMCYDQGHTVELDTILFLAGLKEFHTVLRDKGEKEVSINISARSLRDLDFVGTIIKTLESTKSDVILEIHETSSAANNPQTLKLLKKRGVRFALDDVGLNMNDVFRLTEFNGLTSFMKLDHKLLGDPQHKPLLEPTMSFITTSVQGARIVAEGVQTVDQARQLHELYPDIKFVQGRNLPDTKKFGQEWSAPPTKK